MMASILSNTNSTGKSSCDIRKRGMEFLNNESCSVLSSTFGHSSRGIG
jgi:hypothetical protein